MPDALAILADKSQRPRILADMQNGIPGSGWESVLLWCGWEGVRIGYVLKPENRYLEGQSIVEIARARHIEPIDAYCEVLLEDGFGMLMIIDFGCEEDLCRVLRYPFTAPVTDGIASHARGGGNHPRIYGTFPRVLGRYAREQRLFSMEEAVRRMTALPASRLGIRDRGRLEVGCYADITVFNPETVLDASTYAQPLKPAIGIEHVLVNGVPVWEKGKITGALPGRFLRKGRA